VNINNLPRSQLQAAVDMTVHLVSGETIAVAQEVCSNFFRVRIMFKFA
jgi:hypothetical protein